MSTPRLSTITQRLIAVTAALTTLMGIAMAQTPTGKAPHAAPKDERLTSRKSVAAPVSKPLPVGEEIRTEARERRRVTLPDGSILFVNQGTRVKLIAERRLTLTEGEIFVEAARTGDQPLTIEAPKREISAQGSKFAVKIGSTGAEVVVTRGMVKVGQREVVAGQQLLGTDTMTEASRASHLLGWTRELMIAAESPLVPGSTHAGGALIAVDPNGQEAKLSLRKYHIDVHIEDGFARTTIDQTYFNHENQRLEGTFYFPLPPDASLSRLAMYVEGNLMEGGMVERDYGRAVYESIVHRQKDPALLEWVDGSTFKMRVFPLEGRQEKRIILSYTQRLSSVYGQQHYRFPAGHTLDVVRDWSFHARIKDGAPLEWNSASHVLISRKEGQDLLLDASAKNVKLDRDLQLTLADLRIREPEKARVSVAEHEGSRYLMLRYRPLLPSVRRVENRRDWVFLFESSGDRDPLLARVQIDIIRAMLSDAEPDDTFVVLTAGTRVKALAEKPQSVTAENVQAAITFLEGAHLIGALDLGRALQEAGQLSKSSKNPYLVHVGSGIAAMGERREDVLAKRIPEGTRYVGVGVGRRWARGFMKAAAERSGGHFTQINPDEPISWRAFELAATLRTPRLLNVQVTDSQRKIVFLNFTSSIAHGEEVCAIAHLEDALLPKGILLSGTLDGQPFRREIEVNQTAAKADHLPRLWASLEIDRLLAEDAYKNKARIIALSKAMYVMTPFTSLLVLENEDMYEQYKVDRGRKDHWAMYPCPPKIPVVHEPDPNHPDAAKGGKPTASQVLDTIVMRNSPSLYAQPRRATPPYGGSPATVDEPPIAFPPAVIWSEVANRRKFLHEVDAAHYSVIMPRWLETAPAGLHPPGIQPLSVSGTPLDTFQAAIPIAAPEMLAGKRSHFEGRSGSIRRSPVNADLLEQLGAVIRDQQSVRAWTERSALRNDNSILNKRLEDALEEQKQAQLGLRLGPTERLMLLRPLGGGTPDIQEQIVETLAGAKRAGWHWEPPSASLYERPSYSGEERLFSDLVSYAPGMNTSWADIQAVLEAEAGPSPHDAAGKIDPAARQLLEKARPTGWMALTFPAEARRPAFTLHFDGAGRYAYECVLSLGLRERVVCDGKALLHLYPDLGIGARRAISRHHRIDFARAVPWAMPLAEDLARGADLKLIGERTVAIVPHVAESAKDKDGKPVSYIRIHLIFAADGRLAERQIVEMPEGKPLLREIIAPDGGIRMLNADGKEVSTQKTTLAAGKAPDLAPDVKKLVVLPLPYRSSEHVRKSLKIEKKRNEDLLFEVGLALLAAEVGGNRGGEAHAIFRQVFHQREQRQLGFYVLLAACGQNLDAQNANVLSEHMQEPLAQYLALYSSPVLRSHASQWAVGTGQWTDGFLHHLAVTHALYQRWQDAKAKHTEADRKRAVEYVRKNKGTAFGWALLTLMQDRAGDDKAFHAILAELWLLFEEMPGVTYAARYEHARSLAKAGQREEARKRFRELYEKTFKDDLLPAIDADFRQSLLGEGKDQDQWSELIRTTAVRLIEKKRRPAVLTLAWQCWQLEDQSLAHHLLTTALDGIKDDKERLPMTLAGVDFLMDAGQMAQADQLLQTLLADAEHGKKAGLWRYAARIAGEREMKAREVECLERALDAEYQNLPEVLNLKTVREEYQRLLTHYETLAEAMATLKVPPPADFLTKVIRTADRWRALDQSGGDACESAARILRTLGEHDLVWDYLTTPIGLRPNESEPWANLAQTLARKGDLELADRAFAAAYDCEPTNAQVLWDRAQNLRQAGRTTEAQKLFRQLADGDWQPRFRSLQVQARWQLDRR